MISTWSRSLVENQVWQISKPVSKEEGVERTYVCLYQTMAQNSRYISPPWLQPNLPIISALVAIYLIFLPLPPSFEPTILNSNRETSFFTINSQRSHPWRKIPICWSVGIIRWSLTHWQSGAEPHPAYHIRRENSGRGWGRSRLMGWDDRRSIDPW